MDIQTLLLNLIEKQEFIEGSFSKIRVRPVQIKNALHYQVSWTVDQKAFHLNLQKEKIVPYILDELLPKSKQSTLFSTQHDYLIFSEKKGGYRILKKAPTKSSLFLTHNRPKNYLIAEGQPFPFLVELGLMKKDGSLNPKKTDKFRQINRFLEIVQDVLPCLSSHAHLEVVDFGCGKGYLSFALYHFLHDVKGMDVTIHGLDLKKDVIENGQKLAEKCGYANLKFEKGDIQHYQTDNPIHMVVALHACNTATDAALEKAIHWKADVILSSPCCQHELYKQVKSPFLDSILRHGILKEKFSALLTDALRADILEIKGYTTQILEFVDPEHTPKNLLIRAVKGNSSQSRQKASERYSMCKAALQVSHILEQSTSGF